MTDETHEFPLTMSEREMESRYPELTKKMELVTVGSATYIKHCGEWVLLDPDKHRRAAEDKSLHHDTALKRVDDEAKVDRWNDPPDPEPPPSWSEL